MNITILGSSGFVGSALTAYFESLGESVTGLKRPEFDLNCSESFHKIPPNTEILIHAAGHVGNSRNDEVIWQSNIQSNYYLIQFINQYCTPRLVVFLSSGAVYGMQRDPVTCESPKHPENLYAASKLLAERMFETLLNSKFVILRLFFPFGPGQQPPRLIPNLIRRIAQGDSIEINSDQGLPLINPIYIDQLIRQIHKIIQHPEKTHYNLGGPENLSIRQIASAIGQLINKEPIFSILDFSSSNLICKPDYRVLTRLSFKEQLAQTIKSMDY